VASGRPHSGSLDHFSPSGLHLICLFQQTNINKQKEHSYEIKNSTLELGCHARTATRSPCDGMQR
jgi:hypothetical protein